RTTYEYNAFDEVTSTTLPDSGDGHGSPVYSSAYDRVGNQISQIDPLGQADPINRSTHHVYDEHDRLIQTIQPIPDDHTPDASHSFSTDDLPDWTNGVANSTGASHTFQFTGLASSKHYEVLIQWIPETTNQDAYDKDAQFKIYTTSASSPLRTVYLNLNGQP